MDNKKINLPKPKPLLLNPIDTIIFNTIFERLIQENIIYNQENVVLFKQYPETILVYRPEVKKLTIVDYILDTLLLKTQLPLQTLLIKIKDFFIYLYPQYKVNITH